MKVSITIPKALHKVWKAELINVSECSEETGLSRYTITKVKKSGKCTEGTMDKINFYFIRKREKLKSINTLIKK